MEMGQRAVEGLFHLGREIGLHVVRSAMVLAGDRRKLGLQKEPFTWRALLRQLQQRLTHQRLLVVDQLVRRIDGRKPCGDRLFHQLRGGLFFQAVPYMNEGIGTLL